MRFYLRVLIAVIALLIMAVVLRMKEARADVMPSFSPHAQLVCCHSDKSPSIDVG